MAHNFNKDQWSGTLEMLFQECFLQGPASDRILQFSQFVLDGVQRENELLPLRKYKNHPKRGETFADGVKRFMPVDNEPLIGLMNLAKSTIKTPNSFLELFKQKILKGSWNFEVNGDAISSQFATGGASADFRKNGLKVAHIEDAAKHIGASDSEYKIRYLRSMLLTNVFLFPSPRC